MSAFDPKRTFADVATILRRATDTRRSTAVKKPRLDNDIHVHFRQEPIRSDVGQAVLIERWDGPLPIEIPEPNLFDFGKSRPPVVPQVEVACRATLGAAPD